MKSQNQLLLAVALAACSAGASFAQSSLEPEDALGAALAQARSEVAASPAKAITTCPDAQELETPFELTVSFSDGRKPLELSFRYGGCEQERRNDYLPAYTERSYYGADGYGLTITTNDGESRSDVLVSKGVDWVGQFGIIENEALLSGNPLSAGTVSVKDGAVERKGKAVLRDSARPLYPQLAACEAADWTHEAAGAPRRGVSAKPETGYGVPGPSLVLLTKTAAYYYHEDCDICAEVTKCELSTGRLSSTIHAHSVNCSDMKPYSQDIVFDACADDR